MPEGSCRCEEVVFYLDLLAEKAERVVVVLDQASFHRAEAVRERRAGWEEKGLKLYYSPAYYPQLNPIEEVCRRLKGFLMPRRLYDLLFEKGGGAECLTLVRSRGAPILD